MSSSSCLCHQGPNQKDSCQQKHQTAPGCASQVVCSVFPACPLFSAHCSRNVKLSVARGVLSRVRVGLFSGGLLWFRLFSCGGSFSCGRFFLGLIPFTRVVRHIPALTLKLNCRRRHLFFQTPAAFLAPGWRLIRQFLKDLDVCVALLATKLVNWHSDWLRRIFTNFRRLSRLYEATSALTNGPT